MSTPNPIPDHLMPIRGVLGDEDLRLVLSSAELLRVTATIVEEGLLGSQLAVTHRSGSPWLEIDVAKRGATHSYAIWRHTLAVHRVGPDGAVEDDPFLGANGR